VLQPPVAAPDPLSDLPPNDGLKESYRKVFKKKDALDGKFSGTSGDQVTILLTEGQEFNLPILPGRAISFDTEFSSSKSGFTFLSAQFSYK